MPIAGNPIGGPQEYGRLGDRAFFSAQQSLMVRGVVLAAVRGDKGFRSGPDLEIISPPGMVGSGMALVTKWLSPDPRRRPPYPKA